MTGHALALAAAVSHLGKIEEGQTGPRIDAAERLAAALEMSPCYLVYGWGGAGRTGGETREGVMRVGARLKEARERTRMSCSALGRQSGVSGQTVSNIEDKGYMPGVDTAEQLAKALEVSPCWLAFGEPEVEPRRSAAKETPARAKIRRLAANLKGAALTATDLEPLVDRLSQEEQLRLSEYARRRQRRPRPTRAG